MSQVGKGEHYKNIHSEIAIDSEIIIIMYK